MDDGLRGGNGDGMGAVRDEVMMFLASGV